MKTGSLTSYRERIETDLRQNILPFWRQHVMDREHRTFFGSLTNDLVLDRGVTRGALLTTRILWTYAAAYRRYHDAASLEMADFAYADLHARFLDRAHGGLFWSINADGTPERTRKQVYGQAFGIYALTEYHLATGKREPLDHAVALFRLLEQHGRDRRFGGYWEAFARDWSPIEDVRLSPVDMNTPKSQNTLLHVMEAYTNLLRAWPDAGLRAALAALIDVMATHVLNPRTHHLGLFFDHTWKVESDKISYGHDIEASWLFWEAVTVLADPAVTARFQPLVLRIAEVTLAEGVDADGGVYNEGDSSGLTNTNKEWWPQAEAVVGFLNAYQISGDMRFLDAALRTWDFIEQRLIDRRSGEWFRGVTRDGALLADELKVSFWKCPYHNGRAGLQAVARLQALGAR
jgi:cellobiose epimerase